LDRSDDALAFELFATARRALEARAAQLIVVTAGAQKVLTDDVVAPACTAVWGAARTIAREHPELEMTLLDLPRTSAGDETAYGARAIRGACRREEIALRGGSLFRASLVAHPPSDRSGSQRIPAGAYVLRSTQRGRLDGVRAVAAARPTAGPGQIVIEVAAAALNFRDVMKTLGMYPSTQPDGDWLGDECAGRVIEVGAGVRDFARGDRVVAFAPAAFGRYAVTLAALASAIPPELDFTTAAALPVAYGTSWYALNELARLRAGERVLIHAATGGVGLAAVRVARKLGAEVFATAGSDEKRAYLQSLGVEAVYDSRSLDFVDAIRERTGGAGVNVVLNSLAGEALTATLSVVAPFGRFIEIGKKDIYANSPLPMRPLARNVAFFALDMDELLAQRPDVGAMLLRETVAQVGAGSLPALPVTTFPLSQAERAFRMMAQARHIGKIVLRLPEKTRGCAVVSGGYGGLGPLVAGWLHERGIGTIVLTGRSAPDAATRQAIERAREAGLTIVEEPMDVTDAESVAQTLRRVRENFGPLVGIVHLAGRLDDGIALYQTSERFAAVSAPKVAGIRHLHEQTLADDLGLFVVFSSAGAMLGSPGQSTYTAANAYLEGFMHERRRAGLPGLCVHWGPWAEAGMAARTGRRNASGAVRSLDSPAAFAALNQALEDDMTVATIIDVDWTRWRNVVPDSDAYPLVQHLLPAFGPGAPASATNGSGTNGAGTSGSGTNGAGTSGSGTNGAGTSGAGAHGARPNGAGILGAAKLQLAAIAPAERRARLAAFIAGELAHVMEADRAKLAYDQPIRDIGVDSLMGLELQLRLEGELNVVIPRMALMQSPTIADLADIIAGVLETDELPAAPRDRLRLICFPHAGAGADAFRALARDLRDDIEVVALDYPGRGSHMTQPLPATMAELVDALAADVQSKLTGAVAFLGHSLGALVAFEFIRQMERRGARAPAMLFVSSCAGPWAERRAAAMSSLDDAAFIERLREYNGTPGRVIDDIDLMRAFLPTLRSDFAIAETYRPVHGAAIAVPIVAVGGDCDPHVDADELASWAPATTSTFELAMLPGDHFHISSPAALAAKIRAALSLMHADAV
jgi:surfactin synthase thioesterase subunit/NADPH:quinone reductase-like Zn-dependent oxidoreductase/acyl carrier protein